MVLLILAGITITFVLGENGIINMAQRAADKTNQAGEQEQKDFENINNWINENTNNSNGGTIKPVEPTNIDDWIFYEENGTITITGYKGRDTEVVVPNSIGGVPVTKIAGNNLVTESGYTDFLHSGGRLWDKSICTGVLGDRQYAYHANETITKVTISEGITSIEGGTFCNSIALETVILPDTLEKIGERAFEECASLNNIKWSNSLKEIGYKCFAHCKSLGKVILPNSLINIGHFAFYNTDLLEIYIPKNVAIIGTSAIDAKIIYCEVATKPSGWEENYTWDKWYVGEDTTIIWDYKNKQ